MTIIVILPVKNKDESNSRVILPDQDAEVALRYLVERGLFKSWGEVYPTSQKAFKIRDRVMANTDPERYVLAKLEQTEATN